MFEKERVVALEQGIEPNYPMTQNRRIGFLFGDELRGNREQVAPSIEPGWRITPMRLGRESDRTQGSGIGGLGAEDLHAGGKIRPVSEVRKLPRRATFR